MELGTAIAMIGCVGTVSGIIAAWLGYGRGAKKDCRTEDRQDGAMRQDVEYIKRGVDDIRIEQRAMRADMSELAERVAKVEESAKSAHKRIDDISK